MTEQFAAQVEEEENGYDDGCDILPPGKAFARLLILVWDFFPFPAFFGVEMFCLLLLVTRLTRQYLIRG